MRPERASPASTTTPTCLPLDPGLSAPRSRVIALPHFLRPIMRAVAMIGGLPRSHDPKQGRHTPMNVAPSCSGAMPGFFDTRLAQRDPELFRAIGDELHRQQNQIELIASE